MQEMRRGMVEHRRLSGGGIHLCRQLVADGERSRFEAADVQMRIAQLLRVGDAKLCFRIFERADIADLPARLGIKRRAVEHDLDFFAAGSRFHLGTGLEDCSDFALTGERVVAAEAAFRIERVGAAQIHAEATRGAAAFTLAIHRFLESRLVDLEAALTRDVGGEVHRESEGVVELEDRIARDGLALHLLDRGFQQFHAVFERLGEALLFLAQDFADMRRRL